MATARVALEAVLRKLGHQVLAVPDGHAALRACDSDLFSVVISDWLMPGLNGVDLCRRLRARRCAPYVYFILLTMLGGKANYQEALEAGANDFLPKPIDEGQLAAALTVADRVLSLRSQR